MEHKDQKLVLFREGVCESGECKCIGVALGMDGEVRVQRAQGYSAVHSGKIMLTQAIKVKDTTRPGTKIFLNRCQFSNRCNHEQ